MADAFRQNFMSALEQTWFSPAISEAINSYNLANVVHYTRETIKNAAYKPARRLQKSAEESNKLREEGNVHYVNGEYKKAILCFNKALAFAPINSLEMKLAYGNTSAVMFAIKAYQPCQENIMACQDLGCPENLVAKLKKRFETTKMFIMPEMTLRLTLHYDEGLNEYAAFRVAKNDDVPCTSKDVCIQNKDGVKTVVAAADIKSGTIVALERAFVSTLTDDKRYKSCYNCHMMCLCFVPCEGCSYALFCTKECRSKCMDEYHRIECQIIEYLTMYEKPDEILTTRAAIKMSLKLNWDELSVASRTMGEERLKKSTVKEAFDVSNPLSMLCYNDNKNGIKGRIFNGSVISALVIERLIRVPGYFPEDKEERKEAIDAMSRIMLHLYITFANRIVINCATQDYASKAFVYSLQRNYGWFSFTSKLAHSCEPNLFVLGLNDQVALVAVQRIKKGDELNISYVDNFFDSDVLRMFGSRDSQLTIRQKLVWSEIRRHCECRVCLQDWDRTSLVDGALSLLTQSQIGAFQKMIRDVTHATTIDKLKAASEALDALTGAINTTQHKKAFEHLMSVLHKVQLRKIFNVTYDGEDRYYLTEFIDTKDSSTRLGHPAQRNRTFILS